ncbi:hypothetical protein LCGC14_2106670 [marine sediment metagenome]|uniref:Uncharacterized protein n=1 Tax=marine sediment metagenome TaxID=412755 RepID=A0A0F9E8L3_9ZZZZ
MGELAIVLAILCGVWVYTVLHPYNEKERGKTMVWVVTNILFFGALAAGIAAAL